MSFNKNIFKNINYKYYELLYININYENSRFELVKVV